MNETTVTMVGNLVDEPTLRTTDSGLDVAGFRVAATARRWDAQVGQHVDGAKLFLSVSCWRGLATNVAASLHKGDPVILTGRLSTRLYEKDGQNRTVCELDATAIGPDLARGTARFRRARRDPATEQVSSDEAAGEAAEEGAADGTAREPELVTAAG